METVLKAKERNEEEGKGVEGKGVTRKGEERSEGAICEEGIEEGMCVNGRNVERNEEGMDVEGPGRSPH
jgi:hypothetical protein